MIARRHFEAEGESFSGLLGVRIWVASLALCELFRRIRWIRERRVFFLRRSAGAGALPLYPTRASAALDPVRALGP